ncbi:MgtC/SapB family protein [Clostridioides difficile]|uniref:MgtC/SapB family protein n=1 Tax=Clostridioides difficile TaxID=1496 RepID=UPI001F46E773|nr:MgtC/SapB family protein [Clostridioides difficile]MCR1622766.1 MgtC/SapB family protein [Clostridioides difficile]MCR1715620.1 MgtC/SapB family protein [Clostridioides difficile]
MRQFAGFRTHILIAIGSCIVSITSIQLFFDYNLYTNADPARMPAQVLSGIGFLGAGAILKNKGGVKGLTTAAGMWATACIGIAVGYGYYELAILGGLFVMIALFVLRIINTFLFSQEKNVLILKLSNLDSIPFLYDKFEKNQLIVRNMEIECRNEEYWKVNFFVSYAKRIHLHDVMKEINMIEGVINVDYLD